MSKSFVDIVKKGEVRHPTQRNFTLSEWECTYRQSEDYSKVAQNLYEAGKWVYTKLENARAKLLAYDLTQFDKDKAICMIVAYLNRTVKVISNAFSSSLETSFGDTVFASQLIQWKFDKNAIGPPLDADSILSISIDGARFPIVHISSNGGKPPFVDNEDDKKIIIRVRGATILGQYYDAIENLWLEFLWHGWEIVEKKDHFLILPIQDHLAANRAISDYRRESLLMEATHHIVNIWKRSLSEIAKKGFSPHIEIQGSKNRKRYLIKYMPSGDDFPPQSFVHQILASETYYEYLLDVTLPQLVDISLRQVMEGWEVLHALCRALECRLPGDTEIVTVQTLLQFAPNITRGNLTSLFKSALRISQDQANRLLDFFVFNLSPRNELWDAPLVALSGEKFSLVLAAVLHGNLLRIMERFMKRGGLEISQKGKEFEADCRRQIKDEMQQNDLFKTTDVHPTSVTLCTTNTAKEEIDILLWIGNTFIIAEAKCLLFPSGPMDYLNYYKTLEDAARQAKRKASFANEHRKELLLELGLCLDPANIRVKPLVIVNSPFGAGFPCLDIPVTDLQILGVFLRQNHIEHLVTFNPEGRKISAASSTELYTSEEGAAEYIYEYLCNPPQIEIYKKSLEIVFNATPKINDDDKPFAIGQYEVKIPLPKSNIS